MPTLQIRQDGCHFVRHFYQDHSTWQITGDGVLFLSRRGVTSEQRFSTNLFMDLWMRGLVYYGDRPPAGERMPCHDSATLAALRGRVEALYGSLFRGDAESGWRVVQGSDQAGTQPPESFVHDVNAYQRSAWMLQDLIVYDLSPAGRERLAATRLGVAYVKVRLRGESAFEQYWTERDSRWTVLWIGPFGAPDPAV